MRRRRRQYVRARRQVRRRRLPPLVFDVREDPGDVPRGLVEVAGSGEHSFGVVEGVDQAKAARQASGKRSQTAAKVYAGPYSCRLGDLVQDAIEDPVVVCRRNIEDPVLKDGREAIPIGSRQAFPARSRSAIQGCYRRTRRGIRRKYASADVQILLERIERAAALAVVEQAQVGAGHAVAVAQHDVARDRLEPRAEVLA